MLFNSLPFLCFFPVAVILYYVIPRRFKYIWLLFCSYFFYACQDRSVTVLLMVSTVITWSTGRLVFYADTKRRKNFYTALGFILNLSILVYFKYFGFLASFLMPGRDFNLFMPAGISFYTFQSLSYIMDCYRRQVRPENNILKYALFVSFFPCILSGPIERSKNMLPQISRDKKWDPIRAKEGLFLMLWGYFLKLVIVSRLDILTSYVYENKASVGIPMIAALLAYSIQIYCDFAGYSFIAIGAARILDYNVMRNFRQPYLAASVADFWRRWHISLSTWFRDYLYIPLGGSRKGTLRRYVNVVIVFAVSGIWHGATLNFLIWGLLFALYQILGHAITPLKDKLKLPRWVNIMLTYMLVTLTWVFFRAQSFARALDELRRTFTGIRPMQLFDGTLTGLGLGTYNLVFVIFAIIVLIVFDLLCEKKDCEIYALMDRTSVYIRWGVYYMLIIMILFSVNLSTQEFIYQGF
ncbi:MAG: MBOAT family protein [Lachnospiraceae bacterium]|nr:MBOAT family protein [Lachnospiraceae bacterium]